MSFSNTAGTSIIPTLSRIVLCAAFLPAGYNKVFNTDAEFSGAQAERLIELGVIEVKPQEARLDQGRMIIPAVFQDESVGAAATVEDPPAIEEIALPEADEEVDTTVYTARAVHKITANIPINWPKPIALAWIAALTELVGGALILIGLFSRVWGLGLAIAMGVAFYLTTIPALGEVSLWSMLPEENYLAFNTMFAQLGLFVLAFGVFLTGAGPLSLDRALFKKSDEDEEIEYEDK